MGLINIHSKIEAARQINEIDLTDLSTFDIDDISEYEDQTMWALFLVALVMPWRPQSNLAVMNTTERIQEVSFREEYNQARVEYRDAHINQVEGNLILPEPQEQLIKAKSNVDSLYIKTLVFDSLLPAVWLIGMVVIGVFMLISGLRLGKKIKGSEIPFKTERYGNILQNCMQKLSIKRRIRIVMQRYVKTPALFGLLRPKIILPEYVAYHGGIPKIKEVGEMILTPYLIVKNM